MVGKVCVKERRRGWTSIHAMEVAEEKREEGAEGEMPVAGEELLREDDRRCSSNRG